jgi:hypothetical protein
MDDTTAHTTVSQDSVAALDASARELSAPAERLRRLLTAADKKAEVCSSTAFLSPSARMCQADQRLFFCTTADVGALQILAMAAANELDVSFFALLDQNILGAQTAGQEDASKFMLKLRDACLKFKAPV